jgi:hypothetical protein
MVYGLLWFRESNTFGMAYGLLWLRESARIFSRKEDTDGFLLRITLDKDKL